MTVSVRDMTREDIEAVIALYDALDRDHRDQLPWLFQRPGTAVRDRDFLDAILDDEQAGMIVAETNQVVGFVQITIVPAPDLPIFVSQLRGLINAIYVDPDNRRGGVALQLMQAAEAWAKDQGAVGVDLNVYEFNESARALFSATGYSTLYRRLSKQLP